ncbi:MAG: cation:dicarboxylase symporter family transporter, partial [Lachnospiraceae bacterium]|nr:cation:dicarboxylase symporter family transporter [Lachnospiraceae bacterium]
TINMDGTVIFLSVIALALAKSFGVTVTGSRLTSLALTIIILSIGAPGVPGGVVICLSALLTQLGVPGESVGLVMGISPIVGMFLALSNCLGDVMVTSIVAKSEKMMDPETFRKDS